MPYLWTQQASARDWETETGKERERRPPASIVSKEIRSRTQSRKTAILARKADPKTERKGNTMKKGITKLEISRYQQISSTRPLENAYHKATGRCCEIEIENKCFVVESGKIYTASDALVDWYYRAVYNSLADDITIIIDHDRKHAFITENPELIADEHERKWRRYSVTVYRNDKEIEFSNFGDEYKLSEIKNEADERLSKYGTADIQTETWEQSEHTHKKKNGDYSVEIDVIP